MLFSRCTPANGHASSLYTYTRVWPGACSAGFEFKFSKTKYHRPARFSFFEPSSQASPPRGTILICNQKFACAAAGRAPPKPLSSRWSFARPRRGPAARVSARTRIIIRISRGRSELKSPRMQIYSTPPPRHRIPRRCTQLGKPFTDRRRGKHTYSNTHTHVPACVKRFHARISG